MTGEKTGSHLLHQTVELAGRRLIEARLLHEPGTPDRVEQPQDAEAVRVGRVLGHLERHLDVALRAEVVELVGPHLCDDLEAVGRVGQVAVVQEELERVQKGTRRAGSEGTRGRAGGKRRQL